MWRWGGLAAVQRTRIGYGNEGRTKQLAASLSDFIRLFSLYRPASPNKTTHQISCCALLAGGVCGGVFHRGTFPSSWSALAQAEVLRFRRCDPRVKACLIFITFTVPRKFWKSVSASALLPSRTPFLSLSVGNFLRVCASSLARTSVWIGSNNVERKVFQSFLLVKSGHSSLCRQGRRVKLLFVMVYGGTAPLCELWSASASLASLFLTQLQMWSGINLSKKSGAASLSRCSRLPPPLASSQLPCCVFTTVRFTPLQKKSLFSTLGRQTLRLGLFTGVKTRVEMSFLPPGAQAHLEANFGGLLLAASPRSPRCGSLGVGRGSVCVGRTALCES